jgi:acetylglutamate kinase
MFLTDVAGVLDADKRVLRELTMLQCDELMRAGIATGGMQAKLKAATEAVANGVREVSIVKGSLPDIVVKTMRGENAGTKIS